MKQALCADFENARRELAASGEVVASNDLYDDMFFETNQQTNRGRQARKLAKQMCYLCVVREACLEFAIDNDIAFGVYGGLNPTERERQKSYRRNRHAK